MNKRKWQIQAVMTFLAAAIMLSGGCDSLDNDKNNNDDVTGASKETESGEITAEDGFELSPIGEITDITREPSAFPVTVNNVVIKEKPQSAICLSGSLTEVIYELGYGDRLIGRGSYCDYPEAVSALPDFGRPSSPELEMIREAEPDVLITATSIPNIDAAALNDSGIAVLYIPSPRSLDELGRIYNALGMTFEGLFDGEKNGSAVFSPVRAAFSDTGTDIGKFVYITEGLTVAGGDTFESSLLSYFGTNVASQATGYSADRDFLRSEQPYTIVLNSDITDAQLAADDVISSLDAYINGRIIRVSNSFFESPSGRITIISDELKSAEGVIR